MRFFAFFTALLLFGCGDSMRKKAVRKTNKAPVIQNEKQVEHLKQINEDSLQLSVMKHEALLYAYKNIVKKHYQKSLHNWSVNSLDSTILYFGHLFSNSKKHLIVRSVLAGSTIRLDVFAFASSKFKSVCYQELNYNTYLNYAIKDVNGDGKKDFLIHWYPAAGCCRRDIYNVFIYHKYDDTFTKSYRLINPTFYPSEKIIRGVGYGQPDDVELYKFKWNGLKLDTIEFIFPDTLTGKYHVVKDWQDHGDPKAGTFITHAPKEYHKIESYDWFGGMY